MCSECHRYPCHPLCPNAPAPDVIAICDECGKKIYAGEDFHRMNAGDFCCDCIDKSLTDGLDDEEGDFEW